MARQFTFADPGEGIHEAEVVEVTVSPGDRVEEGDDVLVVETDKAETDLPSPFTGTVREVAVSEGDTVEVGDVLLVFADDGEDDDGGRAAAVGELPSEEPGVVDRGGDGDDDDRRGSQRGDGPVPASPATRRLARERGVDLARIEGSGDHGRVTAEDVEAAARRDGDEGDRRPSDQRERETRPRVEVPDLPDFSRWGPVERVGLRGIRRTTAKRVAVAWQEIPHVTHHDVLDVTDLERWRRDHTEQVEEAGGTLSLMVLVAKAVAGVLQRHPRFNASLDLDAGEMVLKHHYHLGLAVDTDDGLVVPVIRDVDRTPLIELATQIGDLIRRVRDRDVTGEELAGGTFTITNVGPLGGAGFTPLIRHPEVAILGMGRARLEPVVTGDLDDHLTQVQLRLPLSLAYDHRIADGADAARFVGDLADALTDPGALLLRT